MLPPLWAAAAFVLFHVVLSLMLAVIFQLAHLTPEMEFHVRSDDDWASHQLRTTADFATHSPVVTWLTGGLNHQVEHHLFPNVAHTHYARLRPIVRVVAHRGGLPCHDLGGLWAAVGQHFALLKALGHPPASSSSLSRSGGPGEFRSEHASI
jgi:linoleoyl-CoA desaturase